MRNVHSESGISAVLANWLRAEINQADGVSGLQLPNPVVLTPLSGDAGMRRYFRIDGNDAYLAVYGPPDSENSQAFIAIADFLREQGVCAPQVFVSDLPRGLLLIENLGQQLLLPQLNADSVESLYDNALAILLKMQQSNVPVNLLPNYDRARLLQEMQLFPQWFISQLLGYALSDSETVLLDEMFDRLIAEAQQQPQRFVHRDFHSRNLIYRPPAALGVIDFQDAVVGPITYDLVSLLKDCYIRWPRRDVERWALYYANNVTAANIMPSQSPDVFLRWFDWMGLQRHIKVLGIFARLYLRDNKPNYLHDLPLVMRYALEVTEHYPAFAQFSDWFKTRLLPLIEQQTWYVDYRTAGENQ